MKRPSRTTAVGLAAALGLTIAVIPGVVSAESGDPAMPFVSTLTLDTTAVPQLTLEGSSLTQTLQTAPAGQDNLNTCDLQLDPSPLLAFKGFLGGGLKDVGFRNGSMGVNEKIDSVCNRVDALSGTKQVETLQIEIPSIEVVNDVPVLGASSASLDIEVTSIRKSFTWQKAVVEAVASSPDGTTAKVVITQGANGCAIPAAGSTSGAALRGDSSNCRLDIKMPDDKYFTKLTLTATAGAFSLEGGSDVNEIPAAAPSTFELVTLVDDTFTCEADQDVTDNNARVVYIGTAGDPEACEAFGITLTATADEVVFLKPLAVDPGAQFIFDVTWTKPNVGGSPALSIPTAEIDFEFTGGAGFTPMAFCPDSLYQVDNDGKNVLVGLPSGLTDAQILAELELTTDFEPTFDGVQFACLDRVRGLEYVGETIEIEDTIYLIGDAKMRL